MQFSFFQWMVALLALTQVLGSGCGEQPPETVAGPPLFELLDSARTGVTFRNTVTNDDDFNIFKYRNFYNGGGVGLIDVNNDGLEDVFLTANMGANKLYLNRGNLHFEDITAAAGVALPDKWSTGVAVADVNADGWLDLYVCNAGFVKGSNQRNSLFLNNGDNTFREAAGEFGLDDEGYTTHAAFVDYDLDGDLDVYLLNNSFIPVNTLNYSNDRQRYAEEWNVESFLRGGGDKLLRNDGGTFTDVTREAGIYGSLIGFGLGITVGDVNGDRYPDFYISNDFYERDYLYINNRDGTFSEEIEGRTQHISLASMGADMADLNNDGAPEIFVTEMLPESDRRRKTTVQFEDVNIYQIKQRRGFYHQFMHNTLQLNDGSGRFREVAQFSGVEATDWSWGALLFDADNDGLRDIYVCNGIYHSLTDQDFIAFFANDVARKMVLTGEKEEVRNVINRMPTEPLANKVFRNSGGMRFTDETENWGLATPTFSNGAAYGDLDNDGDLDLVVNNVNQQAMVYQNLAADRGARSLRVRLTGDDSNPFAVGSRVSLIRGDSAVQSAELIPTRGFQSSMEYTLHFGLADDAVDGVLEVQWPDRTVTTIPAPDTGGLVLIDRNALPNPPTPAPALRAQSDVGAAGKWLTRVGAHNFISHREDEYSDLLNEPLVIRSLSREGPTAAVADVNGDGLDDVFIGGARYQAGQLYVQNPDGRLELRIQPIFNRVAQTEDTHAVFFDADGDGDQDLYVGSGGNFDRANGVFLSDKLYFNDGKGDFGPGGDGLPRYGFNTSVAVPLDYDADGDLDLFVGTRSLPLDYGTPAPSALLENDGNGQFTNVTATKAKLFGGLGMVTGAVATEPSPGETSALAIVREWGAPIIVAYDGNQFRERTTNLAEQTGWWSAVAAADLDGDGDEDLVLGNIGENFYLNASPHQSLTLWVADFDDNGTREKIITQRIDGKDLPVHMKGDLTGPIPSLKKRNLEHQAYAAKSIQELFGKDKITKALRFEARQFASVVAINSGGGNYVIERLPTDVQLSSVRSILVDNVLETEGIEMVLAGNDGGFRPQYSRLDGSFGQILKRKGERFSVIPEARSGLRLRGDVRSIVKIRIAGRNHLLFTRNDDVPVLFGLASNPES